MLNQHFISTWMLLRTLPIQSQAVLIVELLHRKVPKQSSLAKQSLCGKINLLQAFKKGRPLGEHHILRQVGYERSTVPQSFTVPT